MSAIIEKRNNRNSNNQRTINQPTLDVCVHFLEVCAHLALNVMLYTMAPTNVCCYNMCVLAVENVLYSGENGSFNWITLLILCADDSVDADDDDVSPFNSANGNGGGDDDDDYVKVKVVIRKTEINSSYAKRHRKRSFTIMALYYSYIKNCVCRVRPSVFNIIVFRGEVVLTLEDLLLIFFIAGYYCSC